MSKYNALWAYIQESGQPRLTLTFEEIGQIASVPLDHSFLKYKKELCDYGYAVTKFSMKAQTVLFCPASGGEPMNYIRITEENIDQEHICCAMSGKQSVAKKEWLRQRFADGLVFYRSEERGKCFIEYIPAENAWLPIDAEGWLHINCLWVSGAMKGHGYANDLLAECIRDAKAQGKKGLCILCAAGRKREFLADPKFLAYKGFRVADVSDCGINLMYLPIASGARPPRFLEWAKHPAVSEPGFVLYYTDQCPFTYYWVPKVRETAKAHNIPLKVIHITDQESARKVPAPVTTYALFRDGRFLTQAIQSDKKFLVLGEQTR